MDQALFSSGTHYVILGDYESTFPIKPLGDIGNIFAHGGSKAFMRLRGPTARGRREEPGAARGSSNLLRRTTDLDLDSSSYELLVRVARVRGTY